MENTGERIMKIFGDQLRRIIKEELEAVLKEIRIGDGYKFEEPLIVKPSDQEIKVVYSFEAKMEKEDLGIKYKVEFNGNLELEYWEMSFGPADNSSERTDRGDMDVLYTIYNIYYQFVDIDRAELDDEWKSITEFVARPLDAQLRQAYILFLRRMLGKKPDISMNRGAIDLEGNYIGVISWGVPPAS